MFYEYIQNNSRGFYTEPSIYIYIQSETSEEANRIARSMGVYFDGVYFDIDCECCGDRWYSCLDNKKIKIDEEFIKNLRKESKYFNSDIPYAIIRFSNGNKINIIW